MNCAHVERFKHSIGKILARSLQSLVALLALKLYTEQQVVYSILYSVKEYLESIVSRI